MDSTSPFLLEGPGFWAMRILQWPLYNTGVKEANSCAVENHVWHLLPQNLTANSLQLTGNLINNIKLINTYFIVICIIYSIIYCISSKVEKRKCHLKIMRKRNYIYSTICFYWKKNSYINELVWFKFMLFKGQLPFLPSSPQHGFLQLLTSGMSHHPAWLLGSSITCVNNSSLNFLSCV